MVTAGGGRKRVEETTPEVLTALEEILEGHIAGDPMNAEVRWTDLNITQITEALGERGFVLSAKTVKSLVKKTTSSGNRSKRKRSPLIPNVTSSSR